MPAPRRKSEKAKLRKVFVLDAQGGYAGEYAVDEDCAVEYGDVLATVPEAGLADGQSIWLGEDRATAIHGDRMSLIAISQGPLGPEEIAWAKAAVIAAESLLGGERAGAAPDRGVMESLAASLDKREADLATREVTLAEAEARAREAADRTRAELKDLQGQMAALEQERRALNEEVERLSKSPPAMPGPSLAEDHGQLEKDRKFLQRRALEILDREERVRAREARLAEAATRLDGERRDNEALLARIEAERRHAPPADMDAARKEIEMRVKILQQKAMELLDREGKVRDRERAAGATGGTPR